MAEPDDNELTEKLISVDELKNKVILLPWYESETVGGAILELGYNGMNGFDSHIILLPWYPIETNDIVESNLDCDGTNDLRQTILLPCHLSQTECRETCSSGHVEASTSGSPCKNSVSQFVQMGFPENIVRKTLEENGINNMDLILEILLTHSALDRSSESEQISCDLNNLSETVCWPENQVLDKGSSESEEIPLDFSNPDNSFENEESIEHLEKERKLSLLIKMGFTADEAFSAVDASDPDSSIAMLVDFIYASQISRSFDSPLQEPPRPILDDDDDKTASIKKRKLAEGKELWKRNVDTSREKASRQKKKLVYDNVGVHSPKNMTGFGVPSIPRPICHRKIPDAAVGPPFFYYGTAAFTPKGAWSKISRFLFEIEPEFVDSSHFCVAAIEGGYVHNLPVQNRFCIEPIPPLTIQELFPLTKKWWPSWDDRRKLSCFGNRTASGKMVQQLGDILDRRKDIPIETQKHVLNECKNWNLLWIGKNKLASLEPDEMELILGYPQNHTRGGGISRTDRYKSLGNTFQVDTVAYHLSVLKSIFPDGVNVLSLFSGIGGAEIALHRLGIRLKNVVSLEPSAVNRSIISSWWEQTKQKGKLFELKDVRELSVDKLKYFIESLGGFDLVVGGGEDSILFYDYVRILKDVKVIMGTYR